MVLDGTIDVAYLVGGALGFIGKLAYDAVSHRINRRRREKREKREWYEELSALAKEASISVQMHYSSLDYFDTVDEDDDSGVELTEEDLELIREEIDVVDDVDEFVRQVESAMKAQYYQNTKGDIQSDMKILEDRLKEHLSTIPDDAESSILEKTVDFLTYINILRTMGNIPENVRDNIVSLESDISEECDESVAELEWTRLTSRLNSR